MKKMILSVCALTLMGTVTYAQDAATAKADPTVTAQAQTTAKTQEQKAQIEATALPDGVKKTLATDQYKEWKFVSGWHITGGDSEYYVLEMQKGDERATLKLDKAGKQI